MKCFFLNSDQLKLCKAIAWRYLYTWNWSYANSFILMLLFLFNQFWYSLSYFVIKFGEA